MTRKNLCAAAAALVTWCLVIEVCSARMPLEAFQQLLPTHLRRPDRIQFLAHHRIHHQTKGEPRILYQVGSSEADLPVCKPHEVCTKVDLYDDTLPWLERQCRCPGYRMCQNTLALEDGHTIMDKTRLYKLCEPVKKLPKCKYFRDVSWTLMAPSDSNVTQQIVNCQCPKNSIAYLLKKQAYETPTGQSGYQYMFACSPQSRLRCSRKEPCRLFSARKRHELIDEVNASILCQCPRSHRCPRHHTDPGVLPGVTYTAEAIRTFSGYCMPDADQPRDRLQKN